MPYKKLSKFWSKTLSSSCTFPYYYYDTSTLDPLCPRIRLTLCTTICLFDNLRMNPFPFTRTFTHTFVEREHRRYARGAVLRPHGPDSTALSFFSPNLLIAGGGSKSLHSLVKLQSILQSEAIPNNSIDTNPITMIL